MRKVLTALMILLAMPVAAAGSLMEKVQEAYRNTGQFRAAFVQKTRVEVLDREVAEKGEMAFARPGKFSIHYQGERERKYISDGKTLWIYRPSEKEVEVYEDVEDLVSREALVFLGGLGDMTAEFKVRQTGSDALELIPKSGTASFSKLVLRIDSETHLVRETVLYPKSGNRSEYVFSSIRTSEPLPESEFQFKTRGLRVVRP